MGVFRSLVSFLRSYIQPFSPSPGSRAAAEYSGGTEALARFLTAKKHFDLQRQVVRPAAFLLRDGETGLSVFQIDGLAPPETQALGTTIPAHRIFGYGRTDVGRVRQVGLEFLRDDRPIERHGELIGWPTAKEERLSIAQELARAAELKLY